MIEIRSTPCVEALAFEQMKKIVLKKTADVFEWGAGASTLWFGKFNTGRTVSVEHSKLWYRLVSMLARTRGLKVEVLLREAFPDCSYHQSEVMPQMNFDSYIQAIHEAHAHFDLIFVDGRARVLCFKEALKYVKPNGYILLHDFERPRYFECLRQAQSCGFKTTILKEKRSTLVCCNE
jgi:predicted O-methyltransferase YrrM